MTERETETDPDTETEDMAVPEADDTAAPAASPAEAVEPLGTAPSTRRPHRERRAQGTSSRGWWLVLPALVVLLVVTLWPLGRAVGMSLYRSSLTAPADRAFVGLDNYVAVLTSRQWWLAVATTLALVGIVVVAQLVLASAFATTLRRVTVAVPVTRVLLLLPFALLAVVTATAWREAVTTGFGQAWFGYDGESAAAVFTGVAAAEIWRGTGITTIILLAGLSRVGPSLRESAVADGATAWQRLWRMTWPAAAPAVAVAVVYRSLDALRVFEGPLLAEDSSRVRTAPLLVWDTTFDAFEIGLGAAMSVLLLVLAAVVGLVLALLLRIRRVV